METQRRERPPLRPIWTAHYDLRSHPRATFRTAHSPLFLVSPRSPRILPSPIYPPSPKYDSTMTRRESVMLESLDPRARQSSSPPEDVPRVLPPIVERASSARPHRLSLLSPNHLRSPVTPQSPRRVVQIPRRQTIVDETGSLLLSRASPSHLRDAVSPLDRRMSLPATLTLYRRRSSYLMREHLQSLGHVYFDNASSADCFVVAVALRRPSHTSSAGDEEIKHEPDGPPSVTLNRRTIRARVRPSDPERKPFLLQRTFDIDELRATIPELSPTSMSSRRQSVDLSSMAQAHYGRRGSSVMSFSPRSAGLEASRSPIAGSKALPVREWFPNSESD